MKLCWDNIENIRLSKKGNFRDVVKCKIYHIKECATCGEEYFGYGKNSKFCCSSCANSGVNNPFWGKHHTEEYIRKISEYKKCIYNGRNNPFWGKHHTEEHKKKISGKNNTNWKGGYHSKGIPTYETYVHQLDWCESVRHNESDPNILEVKCTHCGKWYVPSLYIVRNRIESINGKYYGENRFYCSEECKQACSIYGKTPETLMKEDAIRAGRLPWIELEREMQPELREMVLERDEYTCQKCGVTDKQLHCHHIIPIFIEPLLSVDIDNCITLCIDCHKQVHQLPGCGYNEIQMEIC